MTVRCAGHTATRTGRRCSCTCGWTCTAPSGAQARIMVGTHIDEERAARRRHLAADRYRPSGGPVQPINIPPPIPLAGQPDRRDVESP